MQATAQGVTLRLEKTDKYARALPVECQETRRKTVDELFRGVTARRAPEHLVLVFVISTFVMVFLSFIGLRALSKGCWPRHKAIWIVEYKKYDINFAFVATCCPKIHITAALDKLGYYRRLSYFEK